MAGDDSRDAANALEAALIDVDQGGPYDDLLEVLALYAPGQGMPYASAEDLRQAIGTTFGLSQG
jgi:hypothetical protein